MQLSCRYNTYSPFGGLPRVGLGEPAATAATVYTKDNWVKTITREGLDMSYHTTTQTKIMVGDNQTWCMGMCYHTSLACRWSVTLRDLRK